MVINGQIFYGMMISAANALDNNKVAINNMNDTYSLTRNPASPARFLMA